MRCGCPFLPTEQTREQHTGFRAERSALLKRQPTGRFLWRRNAAEQVRALHFAPADQSGADVFLTTDDNLLRRARRGKGLLRRLESLLGFRQLPNSDVFGLSLTMRRPTMETTIRKYFAAKERLGAM